MCCVLQSQMHGRCELAYQYSSDDDDDDEEEDEDMDTSSD